jgi:hypothetical protein
MKERLEVSASPYRNRLMHRAVHLGVSFGSWKYLTRRERIHYIRGLRGRVREAEKVAVANG